MGTTLVRELESFDHVCLASPHDSSYTVTFVSRSVTKLSLSYFYLSCCYLPCCYLSYFSLSYFYLNSASDDFDNTYPTNVVIDSDGSCLWVPPGMFKSTCAIDITWFPFDDQKCDLKFGSWTHEGRLLNLTQDKPEGGDVTGFIRNGEWMLIGRLLMCKESFNSSA